MTLSAADSFSMASASDEVFFCRAFFAPEEKDGEASPALVSMEEEWV